MKSLTLNTVVFLISLIVCLVAGEFALRLIYNSRTTTADTSSYLARQWTTSIQHELNRSGYREREFNDHAQKDIIRIAVVGDSITYGQGIELESRYTNVIEQQLNRIDLKYEVLNFGRSGNETEDHLVTVKELIGPLAPDYLLLQWFVNDVEGHDKSGRPASPTLIPSSRVHRYLNSQSILYYLVNRQWQIRMQAGSYSDYLVSTYSNPGSAPSRRAQTALEALIEEAKEQNIPMGIVMFPYPAAEQLNESASLQFLTRRVLDTCDAKGLDCIDLTPAFSLLADVESLWINEFDHHPSSMANQIAAVEIMNYLETVWKQISDRKTGTKSEKTFAEISMNASTKAKFP